MCAKTYRCWRNFFWTNWEWTENKLILSFLPNSFIFRQFHPFLMTLRGSLNLFVCFLTFLLLARWGFCFKENFSWFARYSVSSCMEGEWDAVTCINFNICVHIYCSRQLWIRVWITLQQKLWFVVLFLLLRIINLQKNTFWMSVIIFN